VQGLRFLPNFLLLSISKIPFLKPKARIFNFSESRPRLPAGGRPDGLSPHTPLRRIIFAGFLKRTSALMAGRKACLPEFSFRFQEKFFKPFGKFTGNSASSLTLALAHRSRLKGKEKMK